MVKRVKENTEKGKITTAYCKKDDLTFILKETPTSMEVVGFYFGEPNEQCTKQYTGKLKAEFD